MFDAGRSTTRDFGPHEKKTGPLYRLAKKCYAVLYKTMHFNDIFENNYHISEKNTWLLLTVSLEVLHAALIYLHSWRLTGGDFGFGVKKNTYMGLYGCCNLIFWFPENINISLLVLRVVLSHTVCMHQKCSPLFLLQSRKVRVPNYWPNTLVF